MDTKKIRPAESGNDAKREKVRVIPIQFFDDFPGHPFYVKMDEEMKVLMESIKEFGILTPLIARKKGNERYEIIAGHRRKFAAKKLGLPELPVILRDMTRDEAYCSYGRFQSSQRTDSSFREGLCLQNENGSKKTSGFTNGFNFDTSGVEVKNR